MPHATFLQARQKALLAAFALARDARDAFVLLAGGFVRAQGLDAALNDERTDGEAASTRAAQEGRVGGGVSTVSPATIRALISRAGAPLEQVKAVAARVLPVPVLPAFFPLLAHLPTSLTFLFLRFPSRGPRYLLFVSVDQATVLEAFEKILEPRLDCGDVGLTIGEFCLFVARWAFCYAFCPSFAVRPLLFP